MTATAALRSRLKKLEQAAGLRDRVLVLVRCLSAPTESDEAFERRARAEFAASRSPYLIVAQHGPATPWTKESAA